MAPPRARPQTGAARNEVTPLAQAAAQREWNLPRLARLLQGRKRQFDFLTVGSSGKSPESLVRYLQLPPFASTLVVDIRAQPSSRHTPAWNRPALEAALGAGGLDYLPRPDLGVPRDERLELHSGRVGYPEFFSWYDAHVAHREAVRALKPLLARRPAFLCTELGPTFCHRHRLAEALEQAFGLVSFDL